MDPRQIPARGETFLDHVGLFVDDVEAAGEQFEELGFRVSATNAQMARGAGGEPTPVGTSNRNVILPIGFVELLAPTSESPLAARVRAALERYEGTHLIAFSQADLEAASARLVADGWRMEDLVRLRRDDPEIAWDVLRCEPSQMLEGRIQFALCRTPETVWPATRVAQPDGIEGLASVLLAVEDPSEAAARFARYVGKEAPAAGDELVALELDRGRVCFVEVGIAEAAGIAPLAVPQIIGIGLEGVAGRLRVDLGPPLNTVLAVDLPGADPWRAILGLSRSLDG